MSVDPFEDGPVSGETIDRTWTMASALEQLLENAWGAMQVADPHAGEIEFRAALRMATAKVMVRHLPLSSDIERQAEIYRRLFHDALRQERGRERQQAVTERLLGDYQGPESA